MEANYALLFGRMRSDIIHSVFCLDYGSSDQLMQDYFSYYHEIIDLNNYWTLTTFEKKFTLSLSNNSPANLFLLSDSNDQSFLNKISAINQTNTWWEDTQKNTIVSFSRGSARLLFNDDSLFSHGAGLYDPMAINQEVSWLDQANSLVKSNDDFFSIFLFPIGIFLLILLINVLGLFLVSKIIQKLPSTNQFYSKSKKKARLLKFNAIFIPN